MVAGFAAGFYKNPSQRSDLEMGKENSIKNLGAPQQSSRSIRSHYFPLMLLSPPWHGSGLGND